MKLKKIPVSRAKTAWGLLQDVKRAILSQPKRINMNVYTDVKLPEDNGPACGTIGCFAGWVSLLGGQGEVNSDHKAKDLLGHDLNYRLPFTVAVREIGIPNWDFYVFNSGPGDECSLEDTVPGTRKYARRVVKRINRFMANNETALKTRKILRGSR